MASQALAETIDCRVTPLADRLSVSPEAFRNLGVRRLFFLKEKQLYKPRGLWIQGTLAEPELHEQLLDVGVGRFVRLFRGARTYHRVLLHTRDVSPLPAVHREQVAPRLKDRIPHESPEAAQAVAFAVAWRSLPLPEPSFKPRPRLGEQLIVVHAFLSSGPLAPGAEQLFAVIVDLCGVARVLVPSPRRGEQHLLLRDRYLGLGWMRSRQRHGRAAE